MGRAVRINNALYREVPEHAHAERRKIASQLEFWVRMDNASVDNPDLPTEFVKDLLIARAEDPSLAKPFAAEGWGN